MKRLHEFIDVEQMHREVCRRLLLTAADCVASRGCFHLVLAGGATPAPLYQQLAQASDIRWPDWHIYFSDERCLPAGDPARNDSMARTRWLDHVAIPERQIHPIAAELGCRQGALDYDRLLQHSPHFDLVLLGLGEDGHTASLFPEDGETPTGFTLARPVQQAPKAPAERVSMTAQCLNRTDRAWFLAAGDHKRDIVTAWLRGDDMPANRVRGKGGTDIFFDRRVAPAPTSTQTGGATS